MSSSSFNNQNSSGDFGRRAGAGGGNSPGSTSSPSSSTFRPPSSSHHHASRGSIFSGSSMSSVTGGGGGGGAPTLPGIFRNLSSRQGGGGLSVRASSAMRNSRNAAGSHSISAGASNNKVTDDSLYDVLQSVQSSRNASSASVFSRANSSRAASSANALGGSPLIPNGDGSHQDNFNGSGGGGGGADELLFGADPLTRFSEEKLDKIKRSLWFIIRGQGINTMDGINEFFDQVKDEMSRQQLRDESSRAGGTANLVENMMHMFNQSGGTNDASNSGSIGSVYLEASAPLDTTRITPSSIPPEPPHVTGVVDENNNKKNLRDGENEVLVPPPLEEKERRKSLEPNFVDQNAELRKEEEKASVMRPEHHDDNDNNFNNHNMNDSSVLTSNQQPPEDSSPMMGKSKNKNKNRRSSRVQQQQQQDETAAVKSGMVSGLTFAEARAEGILRAKMILDEIPETEDQKQHGRITAFIEEWSDTVSLLIILSQLFVLTSVCYHAGFNVPVSAANLVFDKLFGDLVAIISIVYRCIAPFKSHGRWHFDKTTRFWSYFKSGELFIDFLGVFPLDLIGYGVGDRCAQMRPEVCGTVNGLWQLNRLLQCRGMFTNFGAVAETLFLRRGLHPILGRCAEVLLFLICLTHVVGSAFNLLLSRGDKSGLDEFFDPGFEQEPRALQYFLVLDWAIKSLVGLSPRGTSFPASGIDQAYIIIITIMGVAVFTNYIATIKLYFDRDCPEKTHYQLVDETIDMVNYMHLEDAFRDDCLDYFNHMFNARFHVQGMKDFEEDLTGGLARKMRFVVGRELVQHIPLLRSLQNNEPFIVSLMQRIEPLVLPPNSIIFKRDDRGSTMLVIIKGFVDILSPQDDKTVVATLGSGKVVGEVALLMDSPRTATVRSCDSFLNVMSLDRRQMSELIMLFPEIAPILMAEMATRMHQLSSAKNAASAATNNAEKEQKEQKEKKD